MMNIGNGDRKKRKNGLMIVPALVALSLVFGGCLFLFGKSGTSGADASRSDEQVSAGYMVTLPDGRVEEWFESPDSLSEIPGAILNFTWAGADKGFYKKYSTFGGKPFYYNGRHGFYVQLPKGMGVYQSGVSELGGHFNEFYNRDTTLIICAEAYYYDVMLDDEENPGYVDSLRLRERELVKSLGPQEVETVAEDVRITRGRIDHSDPENPKTDRFIRKWLLKKDIEGRECEMTATVYFNDSLQYRLPEIEKLIELFPEKPDF